MNSFPAVQNVPLSPRGDYVSCIGCVVASIQRAAARRLLRGLWKKKNALKYSRFLYERSEEEDGKKGTFKLDAESLENLIFLCRVTFCVLHCYPFVCARIGTGLILILCCSRRVWKGSNNVKPLSVHPLGGLRFSFNHMPSNKHLLMDPNLLALLCYSHAD